ncbi:MAG: ribosome biogenesis GTP-binding protein YihA/YsxC [Clostridiales bacterium]|jgi:GTP-binding protein|nr:ribosome biogenesis GTP-binding protein YihA/YsxC [Clostridiales bacterium]
MNFNNVSLEISAVESRQYPAGNLPEIALCGRSNAGKSTLINAVLNRRNFARVSQTPGKTSTINFYNIDGALRVVDLPGYGYAKRSEGERKKWAKMIDEYLTKREGLSAVIQLVDMRHKPSADDVTMNNWVRECGFAPIIVMTKQDKVKKSQITGCMQEIVNTLKLGSDAVVIPFSGVTGEGVDEMKNLLQSICESEG